MRIIKATVEKIEDFQKEDMQDALKLMGFDYLEMNFYRRVDLDGDLVIYAEMYDDAILVTVYKDNQEIKSDTFSTAIRFIDFIEDILNKYNVEYSEVVEPDDLIIADNGVMVSASTILAKSFQNKHDTSRRNKTTTQDFVKKLARVKSSNVWSYAFQPKDDKVGDMLMQFKAKNGGPGDIYIYYNVPSKIWQRMVAAPSKGNFMWRFIRNVFTYAKLTGDKRTHLPNGI
ncbi:MAG: KTSC domain-containing protein [Bacteroidales bacterium]|nr:KTSC domain-containing protein [Bacteroidales bacterium]